MLVKRGELAELAVGMSYALQDRGTTNTRFCGRVWRVNTLAADAFRRFFQNADVAREQWSEREASSETPDRATSTTNTTVGNAEVETESTPPTPSP
jgi:hypothetical protein